MSKLKLTLFILMLALGGYLALFGGNKQIVVDNPTLIVEEEEENTAVQKPGVWETEEALLYTVTYKLSGIEDEDVRSDISRFTSDRVLSFKTESKLESLSEEDKEILGFNRGMRYTLDFTYDKKESKTITSYIVKVTSYVGGAHSNLEIVSFNYDKASGKRLSLNDVFTKPPDGYLPVLAALGDKFLESEYGDVAFHEGLAPEPSNWSVWYATDTSLVFVFQTYQVVPYVYGAPEFSVAASGIAEFINQDYF